MSDTRPELDVSPQTSSHSPRKAGRNSTKPFGATIDEVAKARKDIAVEMSGYFVGPMPVNEFLAEFLPLPAGVHEDESELAKVFGAMKKATGEKRQKKTQTSSRVDRFPGLRFCDTSHKHDPQDENEFQPDISVYTDRDPVDLDRTCWERVQLVIELKAETKDDPFVDISYNKTSGEPNPYPFERNSNEGIRNRAQLVQYASMMWANQPRVFLFQVILFKDCARLLRYDRAGAIVSEQFHYQNTPYLAQFLSRFNIMPHTQRGEDPTVTRATDDEADRATTILDKDDIEQNKPMLKIIVNDKTGDKELIVSKRRFIYPTAIGRGTRCYVAADLNTGKRVFLKDSWRYDVERMQQEGDIYELLNEKGVSNIAKVVYHGDVKDQEGRTDQRSITAPYAGRSWALRTRTLVQHRHYRIVLDKVGKPLTEAPSSRSIIKGILDALIAHKEACEKADILHRDLSPGNIIMISNDSAILIDWDLSRSLQSLEEENARVRDRTGTWQYISHALLRDPLKAHTRGDDLESSYWILLWTCLHHIRSNLAQPELYGIMRAVFDECEWDYRSNYYTGGKAKKLLLLSEEYIQDLTFAGAPMLDILLYHLRVVFREYVQYVINYTDARNLRKLQERLSGGHGDSRTAVQNNGVPVPETLRNSDRVIQLFATAYNTPGWPENDRVDDQIPKVRWSKSIHTNSKKRSYDWESHSESQASAKSQRQGYRTEAGPSYRNQLVVLPEDE
ncbi:hypothetical protein GLOTRDRAFT_75784 [Gloeophyllum trabeum ATCC 11539]|uniref:Protein kinase domain-containing protein n=1 Tax=Gloeophyllum trabeum (strain ATCC 11539 / FP-39264 / Madison 617) TaxID=670483 RepID=S7RMI4_GLOTA|nr:uncharacterized protein GLOTRDRAFT_75784 [Gloeophyllum trabeum ATCC 11539]EPQ55650.1 hypothetical protein GLOTRDRAFT_75784 [Gloeophyllum trabeum ATCC 11539]